MCSVALQGLAGGRKQSWYRIIIGSRERIQAQRVIGISLVPAEFKMEIKDQKKEEGSGRYSTGGFSSAGVYVTRQKP